MWRVYLDVCSLNRPFDDHAQDRIRREAEAMGVILGHLLGGDWQWITSAAVNLEIGRTSDPVRRAQVQSLADQAHLFVEVRATETERAQVLESLGFPDFDALHVACAESALADVVLTTDDRFVRRAGRRSDQLHVRVENPVVWLREVSVQ